MVVVVVIVVFVFVVVVVVAVVVVAVATAPAAVGRAVLCGVRGPTLLYSNYGRPAKHAVDIGHRMFTLVHTNRVLILWYLTKSTLE